MILHLSCFIQWCANNNQSSEYKICQSKIHEGYLQYNTDTKNEKGIVQKEKIKIRFRYKLFNNKKNLMMLTIGIERMEHGTESTQTKTKSICLSSSSW